MTGCWIKKERLGGSFRDQIIVVEEENEKDEKKGGGSDRMAVVESKFP